MKGKLFWYSAFLFLAPQPAWAAGENLASAIDRLAERANVEILYDPSLLAGRSAPDVKKKSHAETTLRQLLSGSDLSFRRSGSGAYVIYRTSSAEADPEQLEVAEILVIGKKTVNADIARSRNDVQPYHVTYADEVEKAASTTMEDFTKSRITSNTQALSNSQAPLVYFGAARSQIDLRGLGTNQTLVLINGRRLPSVPGSGDFLQSDLNGVPIGSINRIETLSGTAGGIFGPGAGGGAMNVVLKQDFDGVELRARDGLSSRGDAHKWGLEAAFGTTSKERHTRLAVRVAYARDDGLRVGDRGFSLLSRTARHERGYDFLTPPVSNSINFFGLTGPLVFSPALGGGALGADTTFLPLSGALDPAGVALVNANAGKVDLSLTPDGQGALQNLLVSTETRSVLVTLRQELTDRVELFLDGLNLEDRGSAAIPALRSGGSILSYGSSQNPFTDAVTATYPTPGLVGSTTGRTVTRRVLGGVIFRLPHDWGVNLDAAWGEARSTQEIRGIDPATFSPDLSNGWASLGPQLSSARITPLSGDRGVNRLTDINLRIAGPLIQLPAGPLALTATGEARWETSPGIESTFLTGGEPTVLGSGRQSQRVLSAFLELRAPLISRESPIRPLRGLELQFAFRHDKSRLSVPALYDDTLTRDLFGETVTNRASINSITIGQRVEPITGLVFRSSFATGATLPTPNQVRPGVREIPNFLFSDPKRGGAQPFNFEDVAMFQFGGSPNQKPQLTSTWSVGAVLTPRALPGLRISVDYTSIHNKREPMDIFGIDPFFIIKNEALYPGRIKRAPLSPEDASKGYTGGKIQFVDASYLGEGTTVINAFDIDAEYAFRTGDKDVRLYAQGTWQPDLRRRPYKLADENQYVGHLDGPVRVKLNVGGDLTWQKWISGFNLQYYSGYKVTYATPQYAYLNTINVDQQGGEDVGSQHYVDLYVGRRVPLGSGSRASTLEFRLTVRNLLDARPPLVVPPLVIAYDGISYSPLGDPTGRRFQIDAKFKF